MTKLPDKPSDLLRMALECLRSCESDLNYRVDMDETHSPGMFDGDPTTIDLAGAVMARKLGASPGDYCLPAEFGDDDAKLDALRLFSYGEVGDALECMNIHDVWGMDFPAPYYVKDKATWHDRMNDLADDLAVRGL